MTCVTMFVPRSALGSERPIDGGLRLAGDSENRKRGEFTVVDESGYGIAVEGDYVVGVGGWMLQCFFPEAVGVQGLLPGAMIAFVDHLRQRNAGLLKGADVAAYIHQESRIGRHGLEVPGKFVLQGDPRAGVNDRFFQTDWTCAENLNVTDCCWQQEHNSNRQAASGSRGEAHQ